MKTLPPASAQGRTKLDEHIAEALDMLLDRKERHSGVVSKINGTTTFIKSGEREFLAWSRPELTVGTHVEFSRDQLQAVRVKVRKETATPPSGVAPPVKPDEHVVAVLAELPQQQPEAMDPEIEDESESVTTMGAAFKRISKS